MRRGHLFIAVLILWLPWAATAAAPSEDEIRQILIQRSIAAYPGNCPCPYNLDRAGRRCGQRSAYSKRGGHAPLCFAHDVTAEMLRSYRSVVGAR